MIESFLQYLQYEKKYSSCTVLSYQKDLYAFSDFLVAYAPEFNVQTADAQVIRQWLMQQRDAHLKASTVNRRLSALRSFYKFLLMRGVITTDPTRKIVAAKTPKKIPTFFPEKEMEKCLDNSEKFPNFEACRNNAIIDTLYQTGIRLSELLNIKDIDIDFDRHTIRVFGKRSKERMLPFGANLEKTLRNYMTERDKQVPHLTPYLYVLSSGNKMYPTAVYRIVHEAMSQVSTQTKCSPHVLRHTFATSMLNNDADINAVKELLGHANLAATQVYTHTTFDQLQQIYQQAHPHAQKK